MVWFAWFRDSPAEKPGIRADELAEMPRTVLAVLGIAFCYIYPYTFFQTWFHTFLVKGRG